MTTTPDSPPVPTATSSSFLTPPPPPPHVPLISTICHHYHPVPSHPGLVATSHILLPLHRHAQHGTSHRATTSTTVLSNASATPTVTPDLHALGELGRHEAGWPSAHVELRQLLSFPVLVLLVRDTLGNPVAGGVVFLLRPGHFLLNTVVVHQDFRNQGLGRFVTCTLLEEHSRLAESISDGNSNEGGEVIVGDVFFSLIATPLGIPVYSRIGFRSSPNYAVHLFELRSVSNSSSAAAVPATNLKATSGNVHYVADQHGDRTNCFETPAYDDSGGNDGEGANTQLDCTIIHACEVATAHTENDTSPSGKALLQAAIHYYDQVVNPPACAEQSDARVAALANHSHEDTARVAVVTRRGEKYKVVAAAWLYTHAANTTRQSNKNETGAFLGPVVGDSIGAARIAVAEVLDGLREDCLKQEGGETAVIVTMLALDRPSERECERMWNGMGLEYVVELPYMTMTMSEKEGDDSNAKQDEIGCCDTDRYFCIRGYM